MRCCIWLTLVAACGFTPGSFTGGPGSDGGTPIDAPLVDLPPGVFAPLHVPAEGSAPGTGALSLAAGMHTIDTSMLEIDNADPPTGVTITTHPQVPSGPELAVLHVSSLTIAAGAIVNVRGSRPLVVIASGSIAIAGALDAAADLSRPGPGGGAPAMGVEPGTSGQHDGSFLDGGGGGAGHATAGAPGGLASDTSDSGAGGAPGTEYGDAPITVLLAGSGGGNGLGGTNGTQTSCRALGGAGGGAIQLSSAAMISISGTINAGGGGGQGGVGTSCTNRGSGAGGGSGGSIVLQAPMVHLETGSVIAANGGGGGGGSTVGTDGGDGGNGPLATTGGAFGAGRPVYGADGGTGGSASAPTPGIAHTTGDGNGGGGGGAAGRIAIFHAVNGGASVLGTPSPPPLVTNY